ncbi:SURF1 family protein [Microbacterium karelineae]|uniref:SURF1 family protein n=1 Tax=Microbacterium karelineae TaxID=2654283 RepID=UPI0012E99F71|nr:SURF1 family cytochrome oxidase biogenesis protein [Microbacterium karelineae]
MTDASPHGELDPQEFPPTLREVMLRPRWLGMLALCLVVAGIFAGLLQWQLSRAVMTDPLPEGATENVLPIGEVIEPGEYLNGPLIGQRVDVEGAWSVDDFLIVSNRFNDGAEGFWVTGRFVTADGASLATAIGWAADRATAEAAAAELAASATPDAIELTGRLVADEGPTPARGEDPYEMARMSPAALLGQWGEVDGPVFRPFLAAADATGGIGDAGLATISSPAPADDGSVNWLNLFYAVEWAVFAAFSFYLWYRLAKDAWERELEELAGIDPDELDE